MDMLVKLYNISSMGRYADAITKEDINIRRALSAESTAITSWVKMMFGMGWAGEALAALCRTPTTCFVALQDQRVRGFACWDVSALGFFGPMGVDPTFQGKGIGAALTYHCLQSMRAQGYGYAIVGATGAPDFYSKVAGAIPIDQSTPGIYGGLLRHEPGVSD
jgi:predicted N-acetyltransferase YhbS